MEVKLCECGCGNPAPISPRSWKGGGYVRGQPRRFIVGHSTRGTIRSQETRDKMGKAKTGELNPMWKGEAIVCKHSGRQRAERMYSSLGMCQECGERPAIDRHHKDGNTTNNDPANVLFVCRSCHMKLDGRMKNLKQFKGLGEVTCTMME